MFFGDGAAPSGTPRSTTKRLTTFDRAASPPPTSAALLLRVQQASANNRSCTSWTHGSLRDLRNDIVHGRSIGLPDPEDVRYATSVVSRILIFRMDNKLTNLSDS